jgi:ABC-type nitrate/sulfonate/bicarbonate transport system ATPase subunit
MKIISGLDYDFEGVILLKGNKVVNKLPFIPEKPSSFPWLDVEGNIKLVFRMLEEIGSNSGYKLQELIDLTGLTGYENHFPDNKSYGFRLRISLARALAASSDIILLDDPFKLMDHETKDELFQLIKRISIEKKIKFLIATSNVTDALINSDKIFLMYKNPKDVVLEISVDKNNRGLEQIKNEIRELLEKENIINMTNFSI